MVSDKADKTRLMAGTGRRAQKEAGIEQKAEGAGKERGEWQRGGGSPPPQALLPQTRRARMSTIESA